MKKKNKSKKSMLTKKQEEKYLEIAKNEGMVFKEPTRRSTKKTTIVNEPKGVEPSTSKTAKKQPNKQDEEDEYGDIVRKLKTSYSKYRIKRQY